MRQRKQKGDKVTAVNYLVLGTEQYLRELPDEEFDALVARCRPPMSRPASTNLECEPDRVSDSR